MKSYWKIKKGKARFEILKFIRQNKPTAYLSKIQYLVKGVHEQSAVDK